MGLQDGINYIIFTNPLSATAINTTKKTLGVSTNITNLHFFSVENV